MFIWLKFWRLSLVAVSGTVLLSLSEKPWYLEEKLWEVLGIAFTQLTPKGGISVLRVGPHSPEQEQLFLCPIPVMLGT